MRSVEINSLMAALAAAQGSYKKPIADMDGPDCRWSSMASIMDSVRDALSDNKLAVVHHEVLEDGASVIHTTLGHESGQWMSSVARLVRTGTFRENTKALEEIIRTQTVMILGVAATRFDDDGSEEQEGKDNAYVRNSKIPEMLANSPVISKDQYADLMFELNGHTDITKDIQKVYGLKTLADMPKVEYHRAVAQIRRIKRDKEEYEKNK